MLVDPGNDLLSHTVTRAVPSALEGLTSVFGMGTGVSPPLQPPGKMDHIEAGKLVEDSICAAKRSAY